MPEKKKMIITGAGGFIGSSLASYFKNKGWHIVALVRKMPEAPLDDVVYDQLDLPEYPNEKAFEGASALVHCAYVKNDIDKNIAGAKRLLELSHKHGLQKNIFMSSFSAHEGARSNYGKQKLSIEKLFTTPSDCTVRAGSVLGDGGLFKQIRGYVRAGKRIPLIDGGLQPMQSIHIDDLLQIVEKIISNDLSGVYSVAEPNPVSYKEFFTALCNKMGREPKFINVPSWLLTFALSITEAFSIPLPVTKENVLGLTHLTVIDTKEDLQKLGVPVRNYNESLNSLFGQEKQITP